MGIKTPFVLFAFILSFQVKGAVTCAQYLRVLEREVSAPIPLSATSTHEEVKSIIQRSVGHWVEFRSDFTGHVAGYVTMANDFGFIIEVSFPGGGGNDFGSFNYTNVVLKHGILRRDTVGGPVPFDYIQRRLNH